MIEVSGSRSTASPPPYLQPHGDGVLLRLKVQPRAARNEVAGVLGNELKIKVTAPPVDSAANEALIEFLAERLRCPKSAVALVRGQTSRHKVMHIQGLSAASAAALLQGDS